MPLMLEIRKGHRIYVDEDTEVQLYGYRLPLQEIDLRATTWRRKEYKGDGRNDRQTIILEGTRRPKERFEVMPGIELEVDEVFENEYGKSARFAVFADGHNVRTWKRWKQERERRNAGHQPDQADP